MEPQGVSYSVSSQLTYHHNIYLLINISRCLAHVINLATQALLSAHSNAKHYDPAKPTDHEPDVDAFLQDEIGLVQAIVVKVSSFLRLSFHFSNCNFLSRRLDLLQSAKNVC